MNTEEKRDFIMNMTLDAWYAYEKYAWGHEMLGTDNRPNQLNFGDNSGATIVNAMSTLWVMGLKRKFEIGKRWIANELNLSKFQQPICVYFMETDYVGSLLSCFALTGDVMFRDKAKEIADILDSAYRTQTGLPLQYIDPKYRDWIPPNLNPNNIISHLIGQSLEYNYLAALEENEANSLRYKLRFENILIAIKKMKNSRGLYMKELDVQTGLQTARFDISLQCDTRDWYQTLVKGYIQSNYENTELIELYREAIDAIEQNGMFFNYGNSLYATYYKTGVFSYVKRAYMDNGCGYLGSMFALGSVALDAHFIRENCPKSFHKDDTEVSMGIEASKKHWKFACDFTKTFHTSSAQTKTGLPGVFYPNPENPIDFNFSHQCAESYFTMWRLTQKDKYRTYAWELCQAVNRHCKMENGGFSEVMNVNQIPTEKVRGQSVHFFSLMKFLYLTFTDNTVLPLDQWIFNRAGHPLPIKGRNSAYLGDQDEEKGKIKFPNTVWRRESFNSLVSGKSTSTQSNKSTNVKVSNLMKETQSPLTASYLNLLKNNLLGSAMNLNDFKSQKDDSTF